MLLSYLGKDAIYFFINHMFEETKWSIDAMKKKFNKGL